MNRCHLILRFILAISAICINLNAEADLPFRNHRFDSFRTLPDHKEGDIVFIGNSITNMMNWSELFGDRANIRNRGVSGAFTQEILNNLETLVSGNPSKVFLMAGTNDLNMTGDAYTPESVADRIKQILSRIRGIVPDATVYYQSILPSSVGRRSEYKISETNRMIEDWINSQKDSKLIFIDLYTSVSENGVLKNTLQSQKEDNFSYDGLHLTQKGYKIWADIIKNYVGYEPVVTDEAINLWGNLEGSKGMRVTYFGAFPVKETDLLILGDEMIHGGEWHELLESTDFKDRGVGWDLSGISIEDIKSILHPILKGNKNNGIKKEIPRALILYTGFSELSKGEETKSIISKYDGLLGEIKNYSDSLQVFIMTILPMGSNDIIQDSKIREFNKGISQFIEKYSNISIIDLYSVMTDGTGERNILYFKGEESPYLSGSGYTAVAGAIAEKVNSVFGTSYKAVSP